MCSHRNGLPVHLVLVQFPERPVGVHPTVHAHEGASARGDEVDGVDHADLAEEVRQLVLGRQLGQVAHPEGRAAH